jgi:hypothetical protein
MKLLKFFLTGVLFFIGSTLFAQQITLRTDTIKVNGECGMGKRRIQKAVKIVGITTAIWNTENKVLTVSYNPEVITNEAIQKNVAAVGHDTEKYRAEDAVYNKLPGCCKYERKKAEQDHLQHH